MSDATTEGIRIHVQPRFHPERSDPTENHWFFSYTVTIENHGAAAAQLVSRHWVITDATGKTRHVRGPGVVSETPRLEPGQAFRYTSFCPMPTSLGSMHGEYQMVRDDGLSFEAEVAPFVLEDPSTMN